MHRSRAMLRSIPLLVGGLLLLASCTAERDQGPSDPTASAAARDTSVTVPTQSSPSPTPPSPSDTPAARNVVIDEPKDGATVSSNPIRIEGRARTFENHVEIRADDENGQAIATGFATARGELGHFNPFDAEILLTVDPGDRVTITAIERSAEDGSIRSRHAITLPVAARMALLRIHFPNANRQSQDCAAVERVVRDVPASPAAARLALEALLRGPTQAEAVAGFRNPFPRGAALRSVNLKNGILTADFNDSMQNVGGSCRVQSIRAAIERTMREIPGVERVVITAMGDEATALQP
ncbi:MAG TPA: Gmad2 immunoglobulin-like domain-containing protein [Thermoanaerobaculia bacterium]